MSDYISREALIGKVEKHYCAPCKGQGGDLDGDWCRSCVINSVLEKVREFPPPMLRRCGAGGGNLAKTYLIALEASIRTNITCIVQNAVTRHLISLPITTVTLTRTPHFARGVGRRWLRRKLEKILRTPPPLL